MHITCCLYKRNLSFKIMLSHFLSFVMINCFWTWIILLFMTGDTFNFENLEEELKILSHEAEWYEENLKKNHEFYVLDQHFYLLTDCDKTGNLQDGNYVLIFIVTYFNFRKWGLVETFQKTWNNLSFILLFLVLPILAPIKISGIINIKTYFKFRK